MSRPQLIRADTLDLQDHEAPSAKDHSRQPSDPAPLGLGPPAPHQASALRLVAEEQSAEKNQRSPRASQDLSYTNGLDGTSQREPQSFYEHSTSGLEEAIDRARDEVSSRPNGDNTSGEDADMADAEGDDLLDDDMMDKISSSPSITDEDIDFEFVYALHTFTATVEGQANATKGDTMVLLDDSNSYWWLVRVVKDSSIGYLPAEHIETPTERLARLNKHRNLELSQTMLSDGHEKPKNPLKKAMRRRAGKVVQFTAPTYYEASEVDYSSEEEGEDGEVLGGGEELSESSKDGHGEEGDPNVVQPLNIRAQAKDNLTDPTVQLVTDESEAAMEDPRASNEDSESMMAPGERNPKSRNGTLRNTDPFFKDETLETRKITLTPNILRDDSSTSTMDSKELKIRASFDTLEKSVSPPEKPKDDKKKKEKKGMLSGLFKRKEKKPKAHGEDDIGDRKQSAESPRGSPQPRDSEEAATSPVKTTPQRHSSKLHKQPPAEVTLARAKSPQLVPDNRSLDAVTAATTTTSERPSTADAARLNHAVQGTSPSNGAPISEGSQPTTELQPRPRTASPQPHQLAKLDTNVQALKRDVSNSGTRFSPITNMLRSSSAAVDSRPSKVKKAKKRVELDDFDSSPESEEPEVGLSDADHLHGPAASASTRDELTESPVKISPSDAVDEIPTPHPPGDFPNESPFANPPGLVMDSSSQEGPSDSHSPVSPQSSPEPASTVKSTRAGDSVVTTPQSPPSSPPSAKPIQPEWNDAALRSFFDDSEAIRDFLIVVHDQNDVVPAGPDHPMIGGLFVEERKKLKEMNDNLDRILGEWLGRKQRQRREERVQA